MCKALVKPVREKRNDLVRQYQELFDKIPIILIDPSLAELFAGVRVERGIKTPDALQLACALKAGANSFITNDNRLSGFSRIGLTVYSLQTYLAR